MESDYHLVPVSGSPRPLSPLDANFALDPSRLYEELPLPADSKCIRILHIPHERNPNAALIGTLSIVSLRDCPGFAALSYVWGRYSSIKDTIECNRVNIPITKNCRDAIVSLRSRKDLDIWIDAICINQADEVEKASQIKLMSEIYTWASEVFIWLGRGGISRSKAIRCLHKASRLHVGLPGIPWLHRRSPFALQTRLFTYLSDYASMVWAVISTSSYHWIPFMPRDRLGVKNVEDLLGAEWINRAWTFQEAVLASNPIIVCGSETIGWRDFIQGLNHIYLYGEKMPPSGLGRGFRYLENALRGGATARSSPISDASQAIPSLGKWRALLDIWMYSQRPTHWNGSELRRWGGRSSPSSTQQRCSVREYHREIKPVRLFLPFCIVVGCIFVLLLLGIDPFSAVLGLAYVYIRYGPEEAKWTLRHGGFFKLYAQIFGFLLTVISIRIITNDSWGSDDYLADGPLIGVLRSLRERQASIPKDKAFALSSVLYSLDITHAEADYEASLGEVYHRLFLNLLGYRPAVVNLLVDVKPTRFPGLPSWVPDWSTVPKRHWLKPEHVYDHIDKYQDTLPDPHMKISERVLGLWGTLEGTVVARTSTLSDQQRDSWEERQCQIDMLDILFYFLVQTQDLSPNADLPVCMSTEIARVVTECVPGLDEQHTTALAECLEACSQRLKARQLTEAQNEPTDRLFSRLARDLETNHPNNLTLALNCCGQLLRSESCLFLTTQGSVGFGPIHMEKGDTVALLRGVAVPMLLRPAEEEQGNQHSFSVIGPAYIEKHMDLSEFNAGVHGVDWVAVYLV